MCVNCVLSNGTYYYIVYEAMHVDFSRVAFGRIITIPKSSRLEYQIKNANIISDANSHDIYFLERKKIVECLNRE